MEAKETKGKRELSRDPKQILKREKYWREKSLSERQHYKIKMLIAVSIMEKAKMVMEKMMDAYERDSKRSFVTVAVLILTNFATLALYYIK